MGASSGGKKKYAAFRNRQRANLSFLIVVMFFAVFGIIVFTEIFLIDERGRGAGVLVRHGSLGYQRKDRSDYEDLQNEDYISVRIGAAMLNDDVFKSVLGDGKFAASLPVFDNAAVSAKVMEDQLPGYPEDKVPTIGEWQSVRGTRNKFFVFSAFYDPRKSQRSVRIIGATRTRGPEKVWCRFWYKTTDGNSSNIHFFSKTIPAKVKVIRENWNLKYSACFVLCPMKINQTVPMSVSIVAKVKEVPGNLLSVINNYNESVPTVNKYAACIKPMHFEYNKELQLLEFIEFNRLLGVEHFTFYNHTIGSQVGCLLKDYIQQGIVTLLPWELDMISQTEIRTEGLFASLNDCLYRSMFKYTHTLLIDLDEYIIPNYNETLSELLDNLSHRLNTKKTGSFSFQNAFFYLQFENDPAIYETNDPIEANLVTLRKTRRKTKLHPHKQRSKYICKPEFVVEAGNHFIWEMIPGRSTLNVPPDAAILHHYRVCEFGGDDCVKTASTVDKTAYRFKEKLVKGVRERYEKLKYKCNLTEFSLPPKPKMLNKLFGLLKGGGQR